jgi:hypothetical protein
VHTYEYAPLSRAGTSYVRVSTPLKTAPWNSSGPVGPPWWIVTLCGVAGSLFWKTIWNGVPAGAVSAAGSYLMPNAVIVMDGALPDPLAAGDADAPPLASAEAPALAAALAAAEAALLGAADATPLAVADAAELDTGVAEGAGAYVQPGAAVVQATTARARRATER